MFISENFETKLFFGGFCRMGGGLQNITDMSASYSFFYAFPYSFSYLKYNMYVRTHIISPPPTLEPPSPQQKGPTLPYFHAMQCNAMQCNAMQCKTSPPPKK